MWTEGKVSETEPWSKYADVRRLGNEVASAKETKGRPVGQEEN